MSLRTLAGSRILALWFAAILLAVAVVRLGDSLAASQGQSVGFYVGSLFVWIIWLAWLVTWRWTGARRSEVARAWVRSLQLVLALFGVAWLAATVLEYL